VLHNTITLFSVLNLENVMIYIYMSKPTNIYTNKYFKNTDAVIQILKPGKLIKGQYYLIQYKKEGTAKVNEQFYTRFRGRFVEYKLGFENILFNIKLAVFEDIILITGNNNTKKYFPLHVYIVKNLYTKPEAYDRNQYAVPQWFLNAIENSKEYNNKVGFDVDEWDFAPDTGRVDATDLALNYLVNAPQSTNLSRKDNELISLRGTVMSIDGVGNSIAESLGKKLPEPKPYSVLDQEYNNARNANDQNTNDQNANQQNAYTKKRNTANAELVEREFTDVDGGSRQRKTRRRKTRRSKMRKNKTRTKRRTHTNRNRK
jgi:hypothetical protein